MRNVSRLLGLAALFLITTGQASTDGCVPAPETAPEQETTPAAPSTPSDARPPADLHGSWQCMTRMQSTYELMFTFDLKPRNTWTDLTFGPAQAKDARYTYNPATGTLRLTTAAGNPLYTLVWNAGEDNKKERLVEQVPEEELYRAQVCYRYRPS
jgi:hypothetical protein